MAKLLAALERVAHLGSQARPGHAESDTRKISLPRLKRFSPRFLRSAGIRFAALYAVLFGISALALVLFLWWATAGLLQRQVDAAIRADAQGLAEQWQEGGLPALISTISERLAENVDDDAIYLLVDSHFHRIAGNLDRWPSGVTMQQEHFELPIERDGMRSLARIYRFDLAGNFHLLVGRDVEARAKLRQLLTDALFWALIVVVGLAAAGALVVRIVLRNTLADISKTTEAISAGDLSRRVMLSGRGDEFDRLAETLNDMLERIGRLMDGVRQVSNAIAHDLRTPITRARTRLEDAVLHAKCEADLKAAIERAIADLDGVVSVFGAILRIAEIEAGTRRSAFAPCDLAPVLEDLAELYGAAAEERGLRLIVELRKPLPAFGDRNMLQQAFANLLDNAIKFSPPCGRIWLRGSMADQVVIEVADEGPGIPEAERTHAVERFYRGEAARSTPGAGLGLALVQAVAQLHGGTLVLADNNPGLRAVITLPRQVAAAGAKTEAAKNADTAEIAPVKG
ncbi:MAG: HAMP domain-containing protein [Acidobacteriia bacterium]|nr:HAMP domain-containing protein [Methyloceanibacter sp.]MCL6492524.1 HAMP domain-containing protein [Terriglobia bacterium]